MQQIIIKTIIINSNYDFGNNVIGAAVFMFASSIHIHNTRATKLYLSCATVPVFVIKARRVNQLLITGFVKSLFFLSFDRRYYIVNDVDKSTWLVQSLKFDNFQSEIIEKTTVIT